MDEYKDIYDRRNKTSVSWFNKASDLHASAGVLWIALSEENNFEYHNILWFHSSFSFPVACWPVYQMIFGMSFELLLKAIIVANNCAPKHIHNLVTLANNAKISLNSYERSLFTMLSQSIEWDGRYPVPKNKEQLKAHYINSSNVLHDNAKSHSVDAKKTNGTLSWPELDEIWRRLANIFCEKAKITTT